MIIPPYLVPGNTIGITCPAGYMAAEKANTCIRTLQQWGYDVMVGKTLGSKSSNYFSAADEDRLDELQAMLDDKSIHAILFGRGGYGMGRIIDKLNFRKFVKNPKWLIGFSDITVLHTHIFSNYGIATMHAPMAGAFNTDPGNNEYVESLREALKGVKAVYKTEPHAFNNPGEATGRLIGGNLTMLVNMIGTASDFETRNNIFFLEDVGEYLYNIDRMFYQLKRNGKFKKPAGLIIGGFTDLKDTERPFGKTVYEIIHDISSQLNCPVCFNFPVSHEKENLALKVGVEYKFKVSRLKVSLTEV